MALRVDSHRHLLSSPPPSRAAQRRGTKALGLLVSAGLLFPASMLPPFALANAEAQDAVRGGADTRGEAPPPRTRVAAAPPLAGAPSSTAAVAPATSGWFDVKSYGARGDGTADDTAAIQAAIQAAKAEPLITADSNLGGSGGTVYFPRGVYRVTRTLEIQHDGVSLVGEGPAASVLKADANPGTDVIRYGPARRGHSGRRSTIRGLGIYAPDTAKCRDAIAIDDVTWWRIEDVQTFNAGRYGLKVGGTINGTAINLRTWNSGDSGVFVDKSAATATGETTTSFYALYSAYNQKHGVHIRRGHVVTFYSPIVEYNGRGGDPANGSGFKIGDRSSDGSADVWMYAPYFEDNLGWDIWAGDVPSNRQAGWVYVFGGFAGGYAPKKAAGYSFIRADYAQVHVSGVRLAGTMTHGPSVELNTYAGDPRGAGGASGSTFRAMSAPPGALPVWKEDGAQQPLNGLNAYVEWAGPTGEMVQFGRFSPRVGAGVVSLAYSPVMSLDASLGDWFSVAVNDGAPFAFEVPRNAIRGQSITVTVRNARGGGKALSAADPFPTGKKFRKSAWHPPSDGTSRSITFRFDGSNWIETGQSGGDVPN